MEAKFDRFPYDLDDTVPANGVVPSLPKIDKTDYVGASVHDSYVSSIGSLVKLAHSFNNVGETDVL